MPLYELRTYTLYVGKMAEAVKLYQEIGFPAIFRYPIKIGFGEKIWAATRFGFATWCRANKADDRP